MSDETGGPPATESPSGRDTIFRNPFVWAFFAGIIMLTLIRPFLRREPEPPPVIGKVPPFELTDQTGDPFGSRDLAGDVYVTSFFFTKCPSICPVVMKSVAGLQRRLEAAGIPGVRLVSITVDPANDTPAVLSGYADDIGADPGRWRLLTGDPERIETLLLGGFKVPVGPREEHAGGLYDIVHTGKLVLVDGRGNVRGYYASDAPGIDEVFYRSQHVLEEQRAFGG